MNNNRIKIKIIILNFFLVLMLWCLTKVIEFALKTDATKAFTIFIFGYSIFVIILWVLNIKFGNTLNYYIDDKLIYGVKGWLALLMDIYILVLLNWALMLKQVPYMDFIYAQLSLFSFVYFTLMYYLFKRTFGMLVIGLRVDKNEENGLKISLLIRSLALSVGVGAFHFWFICIFNLVIWSDNFWRFGISFVDFISRTSLKINKLNEKKFLFKRQRE